MRFTFFGRLTREKGADLLPEAWALLDESIRRNSSLTVFGEGPLEDLFRGVTVDDLTELEDQALLERESKYGYISYAGRRDFRSVISPWLRSRTDYVLMPSRFLETFGLAALESLSAGVAVIGPQQGGLRAFVLKEFGLPLPLDVAELADMIRGLVLNPIKKPAFDGLAYTSGRWLSDLSSFLPSGAKRILLVNDFSGSIGGTETFVERCAALLKDSGYEVEVHTSDLPCPSPKSMVKAVWNESGAGKIRETIARFRPDVIWCHGLLRTLGPLVVHEVVGSEVFTMATYHDLGLFTAYPSRIESEAELPTAPGFQSFAKSVSGMDTVFALLKYAFLTRRMLAALRTFNLHLVPSGFMQGMVARVLGVGDEKVRVHPHFLP